MDCGPDCWKVLNVCGGAGGGGITDCGTDCWKVVENAGAGAIMAGWLLYPMGGVGDDW